jgi:hypothetical protein
VVALPEAEASAAAFPDHPFPDHPFPDHPFPDLLLSEVELAVQLVLLLEADPEK